VRPTENSIVGTGQRRKARTHAFDGRAGAGHNSAGPGGSCPHRFDRATALPTFADARSRGLSRRPTTARACATVSEDNPESAASVTVVTLGIYSAKCKAPACGNRATLLLRYADAGGRPIAHPVLCHGHGRERLERDKEAGLKVFDDRGGN
jgi:hypothetical protein